MNANRGPSVARRAKEGASADSAEEMKDTTAIKPWGFILISSIQKYDSFRQRYKKNY